VNNVQTVVIGAGQAGLAMSYSLAERRIAHVVLERGRVAERWRSERWETLRLLTPNWQTRLPGYSYAGNDPDGFMARAEVVRFLARYAETSRAPVQCNTEVLAVERHGADFVVRTTRGVWQAAAVVVATGYADLPRVPRIAEAVAPSIEQVTTKHYRRPSEIPSGGVLVVGAAATGVQLALELITAGRRVLLATGHHTRVPRHYRGKDILWWLDRLGIFDERPEDVFDHAISRDQSSFQLIGRSSPESIDLGFLQNLGVEVVGRVRQIDGSIVDFADDLIETTVSADVKLAKLLLRIDRLASPEAVDPPHSPANFAPIWRRFTEARTRVDLKREGIGTIIWATGFKRAYPWLRIPGLLDGNGEIRQRRGITIVPGLYVLGLQFLRHRNSSFIDGVGRDARALSKHLAHYLGGARAEVA